MTDLITRPAADLSRSRAGRRGSVVLSGVVSALSASALGFLGALSVVVLGWATDPNSTGTSPALIRTAGHLWLLAHRTPLLVGGQRVSLAPLGLTLAIFVLLSRAAGGAARRTRARGVREHLAAAMAVVPAYALVVAVVAVLSKTPHVRPMPVHALGYACALALLGALAGTIRRVGWAELTRGWRAPLSTLPIAVLVAVSTLLATGALLVAGTLLAEADRVSSIAGSLEDAGPAGLALFVVQVALAPNAVIWASAYAAGPGFAVGVGTQVGTAGVTLGAVPGLPMLAALPAAGQAPAFSWLSVVGVLVAGVVSGVVLARRLGDVPQQQVAVWMALTAVAAAGVFVLLCWWAGGAGPGRLAVLGPNPWAAGAAVAQWLTLSGVPAAWVTSWFRGRQIESTRAIDAQ